MSESTTPVIVVGAGPVGLSSAICLSRQGIKTLLIEQSTHVTDHPKARGITARSMELFRQWGVEKEIRNFEFPAEAARFTWMTDFLGSVITHVKADNSVFTSLSPISRALVSQDKIEEVLWNKVNADPNISVRRGYEAVLRGQDSKQVHVDLHNRNDGSTQLARASYLIGADGAHSLIRKGLGLELKGSLLGENCSVYCRMELRPWLKEGISAGFFIPSERGAGKAMLSGNAGDLWLVMFRLNGEKGEREKYTPEFCRQEIRKFLGLDHLEIEIKTIGFWTMSALVAESFSKGRVFLVGDAAHCVPPTGGYGMNLGIQDAHNLAWKLAYVLNGYVDSRLLETYTVERKVQAEKIIAWSTPNNSRIVDIFKAAYSQNYPRMIDLLAEQSEHLNSSGLDLGFHYESEAIASTDALLPEMTVGSYNPTSVPGFRAPHVWTKRPSGETLSTLDLFDRNFVFLTAAPKGVWESRIERLQKNTKIPVRVFRIAQDGDFLDQGDFLKTYGMNPTDGVLVRPDGHVAWKGENSDSVEQEIHSFLVSMWRL